MIAIGPETFHGQHRGTGSGLQSAFNRVAGNGGVEIRHPRQEATHFFSFSFDSQCLSPDSRDTLHYSDYIFYNGINESTRLHRLEWLEFHRVCPTLEAVL